MLNSSTNALSHERRSQEPDIVKDVPDNAVGSPETPINGLVEENKFETQKNNNNINKKCNLFFFKRFSECVAPIFSVFRAKQKPETGIWEIPSDEITEYHWLGSGAQGAVFFGRWKNKDIAIKKVRHECDAEIKHLKHLDHPNIVKFKGVCTQSSPFCLIMEFCPYGQLYEALRNGKEITPTLLVNWARQIADGMAYLHLFKIIHRDLKSPNILVSNHETLKISDFGTWKQMSEKSAKMTFTGTVSWMAPEVIRNDPCSEKVDIWSYGVLVWELLTGEVPYKGVDYSALIWGVGNNSLRLPVPTTCPEGFKLLLNLCWKSKANNRPSFRQVLMHIDIAATDVLTIPKRKYLNKQVGWRQEVDEYFDWLKAQGSQLTLLDDDLVAKKREEIIQVREVRKRYEERLVRANELYQELNECMKQLHQREEELKKKEDKLKIVYTTNDNQLNKRQCPENCNPKIDVLSEVETYNERIANKNANLIHVQRKIHSRTMHSIETDIDENRLNTKKPREFLRLQIPAKKPRARSFGSSVVVENIYGNENCLQKDTDTSLSRKSLDELKLTRLPYRYEKDCGKCLNEIDRDFEDSMYEHCSELEWDLHEEVIERIRDIGLK